MLSVATAFDYGSRCAALRAWIWNSPQWVWPADSDRVVATDDAEERLPDNAQLVGDMCEDGACSRWALWCRVGRGIWRIETQAVHVGPGYNLEFDLTADELLDFLFAEGSED